MQPMDTSKGWLRILAISNKQKPRCKPLKQNCGRFFAIPDPLCIFNAEGQLVCAMRKSILWRNIGGVYGKTLHQLYAKEQADEFLVTFSRC